MDSSEDKSTPPAQRKKGLPSAGDEFSNLIDSFQDASEPEGQSEAQSENEVDQQDNSPKADIPVYIPLTQPSARRNVVAPSAPESAEKAREEPDEEPLEGEIADESELAPRPPAAEAGIEEDEALWSQIDLSSNDDEEEILPPSLRPRVPEEKGNEPPDEPKPAFEPTPAPAEVFASAAALESESEDAHEVVALKRNEGGEEGSELCVVARRGVFTGANTLSIISSNLLPDYDEMNNALAAFADLAPDERGFIRISIRSAPEFKTEARNWVTQVKSGIEPDAPKDSPITSAFGWLSYTLRSLWFHSTKSSSMISSRPPMKPGAMPTKRFGPSQLTTEKKQEIDEAAKKASSSTHFDVVLHIGAVGNAEDRDNLTNIVTEVAGGYSVYHTPHQEFAFLEANPIDACRGRMPGDKLLVLSAAELGELAKVPDGTTRPEGLMVKNSTFKHIIPDNPVRMDDPYNPPDGIIPLGVISPNSEDAMFVGIRNSELDQHLFFCGRTGSGKTELMKWQVFGVAKANYPIVVIAPPGGLCDDLLNALVINCPERLQDIVFCDLGDEEWPVALNPLDIRSREQLEPTVDSVKEMLQNQMALGKESAPRAVNYAEQALIALCEANLELKDPETKCTLLHIVTFFLDADFRQAIVSFTENQSVRESFDPDTGLFETYSDKQRTEIVQPIVRAFQPLGNSASFSAVFSAGENRLSFPKLISENKIILVKLARFQHQARLGEFVGSLILPYLLSSVGEWGRKRDAITREETGLGCRVFVDEAPTLLGPNSAAINILAEARKFDLGLIFASQFLDQFDPSVIKGTLGNTSSKLSLVLDPSSARTIAASIAGGFGPGSLVKPDDIAILPNFHWYGSLLWPTDGGLKASSGVFSAACLSPIRSDLGEDHLRLRQEVIDRSRVLICNKRAEILDKQRTLIDNIKAALSVLHTERLSSDRLPADLQPGSGYGIDLGSDPSRIWRR